MPAAPRQCGSAPQEFHCPLPQGSAAVVTTGVALPTAHRQCSSVCPKAVRQCATGVPLPTAPRQCGSVPHESHCPLPSGSVAVSRRSSTTHCPQAVRQCSVFHRSSTAQVRRCTAGFPLPTAPRQWSVYCRRSAAHNPRQCGSVPQEFHWPLPLGSVVEYRRRSTGHYPKAVWWSTAGVPLPTAPRQSGGVP